MRVKFKTFSLAYRYSKLIENTILLSSEAPCVVKWIQPETVIIQKINRKQTTDITREKLSKWIKMVLYLGLNYLEQVIVFLHSLCYNFNESLNTSFTFPFQWHLLKTKIPIFTIFNFLVDLTTCQRHILLCLYNSLFNFYLIWPKLAQKVCHHSLIYYA